jgi:hypothetical protein
MTCYVYSCSVLLTIPRKNNPTSFRSVSKLFWISATRDVLQSLIICTLLVSRKPLETSKCYFAHRDAGVLTGIASVSPGKESAFYAPFVKAANIAFACLAEITVPGMKNAGGGLDIICQQNDPKLMFQTHQGQESIRKPDVVIIPFSYDAFPGTENEPDPRGTRLVNARNQPKKSLLWKDVLVCIEFKRSESAKKKAMPKPKDRYAVAKYVATKPEYRRVEPVVPEAPATATTGASQTQSGQPQAAAPVVECKQLIRVPEVKLNPLCSSSIWAD